MSPHRDIAKVLRLDTQLEAKDTPLRYRTRPWL